MPLIDLKTDLKSLRYGKDRTGGGDSGQPYIKSSIPDNGLSLGNSKDFLLRGGLNTPLDSATDVLRIGKMFADLKSPSGLLFTAKQNLLSRTATRTQASGILNEGIYTPLSTLAQAGVNAFGIHLSKQTTVFNYSDVVTKNQSETNNRLVNLYETKITKNSAGQPLTTYVGGPGSDLGIGNTLIKFSDQRTGKSNANFSDNWFTKGGVGNSPTSRESITSQYTQSLLFGASLAYNKLTTNTVDLDILNSNNSIKFAYSIYNSGSTFPDVNTELATANKASTLSQEELYAQGSLLKQYGKNSGKLVDFRAALREGVKESTTLSNAPSYIPGDGKTIETRVLMRDPGNSQGKNLISYTKGSGKGPVDKINALPIYRSSGVTSDKEKKNDLVKFRIAVMDNDNPTFKTFIHFRALLDSISDNYSANWNPRNYLGRGENFYTYGTFDRSVSLGWTVAAQSKEELIPMYTKLNYLASTLAPDYSGNGYMKGNIVQLTIGGYLYEQPGIITSLNYTMEEAYPWEIGINDEGDYDPSVKELTQIIKVSGFNFIPIHNFVPQVQNNTFGRNGVNYGKERYIALSNGGASNYDD